MTSDSERRRMQRGIDGTGRPTRHNRDVFHAWMLQGAKYAGPLDMPVLQRVEVIPNKLVAFSDVMHRGWEDYDCWVHFFEDDCVIERFWHNPKAYIEKLSRFRGVIGLDYSVCWDFPLALKRYNHWRNSACTFWLQQQLQYAIPQARCEGNDGDRVLVGFPKHSVIAIGARSMVRDVRDREVLKRSVRYIVDDLEPTCLVWYGSTQYGVADYALEMGVPVVTFPGKGRGKLSHHEGGDE